MTSSQSFIMLATTSTTRYFVLKHKLMSDLDRWLRKISHPYANDSTLFLRCLQGRYEYSCAKSIAPLSCRDGKTEKNDDGGGGAKIQFLDRHNVKCEADEVRPWHCILLEFRFFPVFSTVTLDLGVDG